VNVLNTYGCSSTANQTINVIDIRDGNKNKVFICHNGHTNSVSVNAVPAHLAHGDQLGNCNNNAPEQVSEYNVEKPAVIYPNPAANEATILMVIPNGSATTIFVTDVNGKLVTTVNKKYFKPGEQKITLNTSMLGNGTYFVRISTGAEIVTLKLVVLR